MHQIQNGLQMVSYYKEWQLVLIRLGSWLMTGKQRKKWVVDVKKILQVWWVDVVSS